MQNPGCDIPRILLLGTSVNKGKEKGRTTRMPRPLLSLAQPQRDLAPTSADGHCIWAITWARLSAPGDTRRSRTAAISPHADFSVATIAVRIAGPTAATRVYAYPSARDRPCAEAFFVCVPAAPVAPCTTTRARRCSLGLPRCHTQPRSSQRARGGQLERPAP
jgi:hypothetical protein